MKSDNDTRHQKQQEPIQNENEQPERNENNRCAKDQKKWTYKGIENTKQQRSADERGDCVVTDATNERRSDHDRNCCHSPANNELFYAGHVSITLLDLIMRTRKDLRT